MQNIKKLKVEYVASFEMQKISKYVILLLFLFSFKNVVFVLYNETRKYFNMDNSTTKTDSIFTFHFKTRLGENKKGLNENKVSLYLSYCENDYDKAMSLIDRILKSNDVIIYYRRYDLFPKVDIKEINRLIGQFNANIILVTNNYFESYEDSDIKSEFEHISKYHLPLLPILDDEIYLKKYESIFGAIQYIDINQNDKTQISVNKKISDFIEQFVVKTEDYLLAKSAFKSFAFLSYRKKDRSLALDLIDAIHKDKECRKVAIWYDEFLVAGEKFNVSLRKKIKDSSALLILVTPNLINEENYVRSVEFPMAKRIGKRILPIEGAPTNEKILSKQYKDIPSVESKEVARNEVRRLNMDSTEDDADKLFGLGVAYLNGIEVEINRKIAVEYLDAAAKKGSYKAYKLLINIYLYGNGVVKDLEKAHHYIQKLINYLKKRIDYSIFDHYSYEYINFLIHKGNIENYLYFDPIKNLNNQKQYYEELQKFKTCAEDCKEDYALIKLQVYSTLLMMVNKETRELVIEEDYRNCLATLEGTQSDLFDYFSLVHYLSFDLYNKNNKNSNGTIIADIFIKFDRFYSQEPEMACRVINDGAAYNIIRKSERFNNPQLFFIFKHFLSYFDYYKDDVERLNKSAELIVELYDVSSDCDFKEKNEIESLLKSVERVYQRRSKEDSLLLGIYSRLFYASDYDEQRRYLGLALKEINELSPNVFNSEPRRKIKYDMIAMSIVGKQDISKEDKIKQLLVIYKVLKKEKNYQTAFGFMAEHIFTDACTLKDEESIRYCCAELKELAKHKIDTVGMLIYPVLVSSAIDKDFSTFESSTNEWIESIKASYGTNVYRGKRVVDFLKNLSLFLSQIGSLSDERANKMVLSTFKNYASKYKNSLSQSYLTSSCLQIFAHIFNSRYSDYYDDCYSFALDLFKKYLCHIDHVDSEVLSILNIFKESAFSIIVCDINEKHTVNASILNEVIDCCQDIFNIIGANNLPNTYVKEIGVLAILGGLFNKRDDFWEQTSEILSSLSFYRHSVLVDFYRYIIWSSTYSNEEKAKLLKDAIYYISESASNPIDQVAWSYKGTFILCLNLLMNRDFELLHTFNRTMLDGLPYDAIHFRFYNYLKLFIHFDENILKIKQTPLNINDDAFTIITGSLITESIDLLEVLIYYADFVDELDLKMLAYSYSIYGAVHMMVQIQSNLYHDLQKVITKSVQCLEAAYKVFDDDGCFDLYSLAQPLFDYADKEYSEGAPLWYLQLRIRFMAILFECMVGKEDYNSVLSYFSTYLNLDKFRDFSLDLTDKFSDTLAYVIIVSHIGGEIEAANTLINYGLEYFEYHLEEYDLHCFGLFFGVMATNISNAFIDSLVFICNHNNDGNHKAMAEAYFTLINAYDDEQRYETAIFFAKKLIEYLDNALKQNAKDEIVLKAIFTTYIKASMLFEKIGDDESAFQYKELAKRYL